ncbi:hypothetical protein [Sporosarcina aquimarina]|uniref:Uncharacterized protein n=1 Tax=Sporosarcina aquimarina TaxID=114975 RepID=A0ABU4G1Y8_9BACL|nr:hypothetical protein [Sporosarcina aquimarina]MDW0109672.1 hypothetical protein [Sporosarcina aquimarina]
MVIGIALLLLSPVLVFLLPNFVANTLYFKTGSWFIFVSGGVYMIYTIGMVLLIAVFFVLYVLNLSKKAYYISAGLALMAVLTFYIASLNYTMLSDDEIVYRPLFSFETHSYNWSDVEKAKFRSIHADDGTSQFDVTFNDGEKLTFTVNRLFSKFLNPVESRLSYEGVEVEKILVPKKE